MRKKLLIVGGTVFIVVMVPVAALNLFRGTGDEGTDRDQTSEIIREDDREITGDPSDEENRNETSDSEKDQDEDPKEKTEDEKTAESGDSNKNSDDSGDSGNSKEDREKDGNNGDENGDNDGNGNGNDNGNGDENEKETGEGSKDSSEDSDNVDWRELKFAETLEVFLADVDGELTRGNLAKLSVLFYEQMSGNQAVAAWDETFEDTKNPWVLKAYNLEIVPRPENGTFEPERPISRQEGAYTFYRTLRALNRSYPDGDFQLKAGDTDRIEEWAYEAMSFMDYYKILPRRESDRVHPDREITAREIKALWNNTYQWVADFEESGEKLKAPTGVFAYEDDGSAKIGWEPVPDADYYYVYESFSKDGPFHKFQNREGNPMQVKWDEDFSLEVTGLTEGKTYYYQVRAVVDGIRSPSSETVNVQVPVSGRTEFEDYKAYLRKDHGSFALGDTTIDVNHIEITRGTDEDTLRLRYYLNAENSKKLRSLIRNGYHEDLRTLYGQIVREMGEFYDKDIEAHVIYEDFGLKEYPERYRDNQIEPDPIGEGTDDTYYVWFPYLELIWDGTGESFTHRWFYRNHGV